jgi:biotin carboxyl carrier protein
VGVNDHRGHYRMRVLGAGDAVFHRDPAAVGPPHGRQAEVRVVPQTADDRAAGVRRYEATVAGWVFEVAVEDEPRALLRERAGQVAERGVHAGSDTVTAQIPGRVVRLWVTEGDTVEAGQRLLAIEAMKMENEVRAKRAGTVERIHVTAGISVELGDELVTVR